MTYYSRMPDQPVNFESLSDRGVMALVARGDQSALGELYDRYGAAAHSLALRVIRDRELAEDVVQEAFVALWRSAATYDPARANPSTWILTLVHRRAVDMVRHRSRRSASLLEPAVAESIPAEGDDAGSRVWGSMVRARIGRALRRLPDDMREAIELAYFEGYSQSELSELLHIPLGTVKTRTARGLALLREDLDSDRESVRTP